MAGKVAFAAIARCAYETIANASTAFLITKLVRRVLFRALSSMYLAISITILEINDKDFLV